MSRIANNPITIPTDVNIRLTNGNIEVKGSKGSLSQAINPLVSIEQGNGQLVFSYKNKSNSAIAGTTRSLVQNMVTGVREGFEKKLKLVGVGYRAQSKGKVLNLTLGFSHPIDLDIPEGINIEIPSQTDLVIKGIDKQKVGQFAANVRAIRRPEPYKGKGVRYADEVILLKETKKK